MGKNCPGERREPADPRARKKPCLPYIYVGIERSAQRGSNRAPELVQLRRRPAATVTDSTRLRFAAAFLLHLRRLGIGMDHDADGGEDATPQIGPEIRRRAEDTDRSEW